jgi:hypothetical protein
VYPREEGCRYRDIFEEQPSGPIELHWLVAILLIKLHLIEAFDAKKKKKKNGEEVLEDEISKVESNRLQVPKLLDEIHKSNRNMLPALINPTPFMRQCFPPFSGCGDLAEAYRVLIDAHPIIMRIPGAVDLLIEQFGSNPTYDTNLNSFGIIKPEFFTGEI